jgi:hypothetical protein
MDGWICCVRKCIGYEWLNDFNRLFLLGHWFLRFSKLVILQQFQHSVLNWWKLSGYAWMSPNNINILLIRYLVRVFMPLQKETSTVSCTSCIFHWNVIWIFSAKSQFRELGWHRGYIVAHNWSSERFLSRVDLHFCDNVVSFLINSVIKALYYLSFRISSR